MCGLTCVGRRIPCWLTISHAAQSRCISPHCGNCQVQCRCQRVCSFIFRHAGRPLRLWTVRAAPTQQHRHRGWPPQEQQRQQRQHEGSERRRSAQPCHQPWLTSTHCTLAQRGHGGGFSWSMRGAGVLGSSSRSASGGAGGPPAGVQGYESCRDSGSSRVPTPTASPTPCSASPPLSAWGLAWGLAEWGWQERRPDRPCSRGMGLPGDASPPPPASPSATAPLHCRRSWSMGQRCCCRSCCCCCCHCDWAYLPSCPC